ncbi:hypothetical protein FOXG_13083 [Fusarium oxysporum f. sp. lycopersici 4287]|uniref:Uncharacterized protein n=2 Tax=Fusarium oxysporum TaxID=5507 RepID=A0A0J9VT45_FUSO4|nr:hypothetical protein FOXG_13083 [Fusarium oxysporum f. sp. lycopersici 4287]KNB14164.1 hypothetical protein FOXG_13083 [Fusarium oxysporum f. sp. lycopersici 4287]
MARFNFLTTLFMGSTLVFQALAQKNTTAILKSLPKCAPKAPTALVPECWVELEVEEYLIDWWATSEASCGSLGFAQCFLKNNRYPGLTCDEITVDTCPPIDTNGDFDSQQQFYALWNIYAIHQFFTQYIQALSNSVSLAAGQIGDIVYTVNPPKEAKVSKNLIAVILGATVGEFGATKELLGNWQSKMILAGIQGLAAQGGGIITWLGNKNSNNYLQDSMQIGDLSASLSIQVKDYQGTLGTAIKTAQANVTQFLALTKEGGFTQRGLTSLTAQMDGIYKNLVSYIYSSALQANGIFLTKQYSTDPVQMASSTGDKLVNCTGLDSNNSCDQYWVHDGNTYSFGKVDDCGWRFTEMWYTTLQKGWLTPEALFLGSDACAGNQPFFDGTAFTMNCTSYTPTCVYTTDAVGQFQNCPNQNAWMRGVWEHKVPWSYLGSKLDADPIIERC